MIGEGRPSATSMRILSVVVTVMPAVIYGPYVVQGTYFTDDWYNILVFRNPPEGILQQYVAVLGINPRRPIMWAWYLGANSLLGDASPRPYLLLALILVCMLSLLVFRLMISVGLPMTTAALTTVIYNASGVGDSVRVWWSGSVVLLAACLGVAGTLGGLRAVASREPVRAPSLWLSVACWIMAVGTYEAMYPYALLAIGLYWIRSVNRAAWAWVSGLTLAAVLTVGVVFGRHVGGQVPGYDTPQLGYLLHRGLDFLRDGPAVIGSIVGMANPAGNRLGRWILMGALLASGALVMLLRSDRAAMARLYLGALAAGCVLVLAGYLVYLAAPEYMTPLSPGWDNRVNALASLGLCLLLVSGTQALFWLVLPRCPELAASFATAACIGLAGAALVANLTGSLTLWRQASASSRHLQNEFRETVLDDFTCGNRQYVLASDITLATSPGFFVFENPTALSAMLVSLTDCPTAAAVQVDEYRVPRCLPNGVEVPQAPNGSPSIWEYGETVWYERNAAHPLLSRAMCDRVLASALDSAED